MRGFFVAAGLLRARPRRRRRHRQGDGRVDRRRRAVAGPVGDGRPALRRALPLAVATRSSARARSTRPTTTSSTPATSARPAGRCGSRAPTPGTREHGAAFGEKSGWERVNWYESNARGGRRGAAPARLGGQALVAGDRRRARRLPRARRRCSTSRRSPRSRSPARARRDFLEWLCDNRVARERRADHLHADAQPRAAGSSATSPSRAWRRSCSRSSPARRSATTTSSWIRRHAPRRRVGARERRDRALGVLRAVGPARARRPRAADARPARLRLHDDARARRRRRAGARAAGDLRRRAGLGALLPDRVRRRRCGARCGRPGEPHGLVAGGYRAIDTLRLEKGYRVWGADITPDETPHEAGLGFCVKRDKDFARARRARATASRRSACAASCSTTRARSRWATSRCASTARSSGA